MRIVIDINKSLIPFPPKPAFYNKKGPKKNITLMPVIYYKICRADPTNRFLLYDVNSSLNPWIIDTFS
jgi:hypothetical protein